MGKIGKAGKVFSFVILAVLTFLSCENPIQAGLGGRVDITPPSFSAANPITPSNGAFVFGTIGFTINAEDDLAVSKVEIAFLMPDPLNPAEKVWIYYPATLNPDGTYAYPFDTTQMPDGDMPVKLRATDGTGKSGELEVLYTVKNGPPTIEVQIPPEPEPGKQRELIAGGVMIGIATDLWGVAPGYPQIQFWRDGDIPPDPLDIAAWKSMDRPDAANWNTTMDPLNGKKATEFRFNAVNHDVPENTLLLPGFYHYRFLTMDAAGVLFNYPPLGSEKDYEDLSIVSGNELPNIEFTRLPNDYQRQSFFIKAQLSHSLGINMVDEFFAQKEGEAAPVALTYNVGPNTPNEDGKLLTRSFESFEIVPNQPYNTSTGEPYTFTDGAYEFTLKVISNQGSIGTQTYRAYIDTTAPVLNISQVEGAYAATAADAYTVNGVVRVSIGNPMEENGLGRVGSASGPRELKYFISPTVLTINQLIAEYEGAYHNGQEDGNNYFDTLADAYTAEPGSLNYPNPYRVVYSAAKFNTIVIDTTSLADNSTRYLYLIAKDKAANYGYTSITLNVDQETDRPRITIDGFDPSIRSDTDHGNPAKNPSGALNSLTSGRTISGTITDDDGLILIVDPANPGYIFNYDTFLPPTAVIPLTGDMLRINDSNPKQITFEAHLPEDFPDGKYTLEINVQDDKGKKNEFLSGRNGGDLDTVSVSTSLPSGTDRRTYFMLDTKPPKITPRYNGAAIAIGGVIASPGAFNLDGTVQDDMGVRRLEIRQQMTLNGLGQPISVPEVIIYNQPTDPALPFKTGITAHNDNDWALIGLPRDPVSPYAPILSPAPVVDGVYTYTIKATDNSTKTNDPEYTIIARVDTTGPALTVGTPGIGHLERGTPLFLSGTARDTLTPENPEVWYAIDRNTTIGTPATPAVAALLPGVWTKAQSGASWYGNVDVDALVAANSGEEGTFWAHFVAYDSWGNKGQTDDRSFMIDTKAPEIQNVALTNITTFPSPDEVKYVKNNWYSISFDAYDANALADVIISKNGTVLNKDGFLHTDSSGDYTLTLDKTGPGTNDPKKWIATLNLASQADGNYRYDLEVKDVSGLSVTQTFNIRVDTTGPALTLTTPSGSEVRDSALTLSGRAPDATLDGLSVWYKIDTTSTPTSPVTFSYVSTPANGWTQAVVDGESWNQPLTLTEGTKYAHLVAFDKLENPSSVIDKTLYIDYELPYITDWTTTTTDITLIDGVNYAKNFYSIEFTAHDSNQLSNVTIRKGGPSGTVLTEGLGGDYTLTKTNTSSPANTDWKYKLDLTGQADGSANYYITITDVRGRTNTLENSPGLPVDAHRDFTVYVDTTPPNLAVAEPIDGYESSADLRISGTAYDIGIPNGVTVWYKIDTTQTTSETGTPTTSGPLTLTGWNLVVAGSYWNRDIPHGRTNEGAYWASFIAYDKMGNKSSIVNRQFYVDSAPPTISAWTSSDITTPGSTIPTILTVGTYSFDFTAYDSNSIRSVTLKRDGVSLIPDGSPHTDTAGTYTLAKLASSDTNNWHYTVSLGGQVDGNYTYDIEINDIANKDNNLANTPGLSTLAYKTFKVRVDTTGPDLTVSAPTINFSAQSSSLFVSGTAVDALTTDAPEVYYTIARATAIASYSIPPSALDAAALAGNGTGGTWKKAGGAVDWSDNFDLSLLSGEGTFVARFVAYDRLGNQGGTEDRIFSVDTQPPSIKHDTGTGQVFGFGTANPVKTFSGDPVTYAKQDAYSFSFRAYDSNELADVSISKGGTPLTKGGPYTDASGTYTFTIEKRPNSESTDNPNEWLVTLDLSGQQDSRYSYVIEITDKVGRTNTDDNNTPGSSSPETDDDHNKFTVQVDTTGPTLSGISPANNYPVDANSLPVSGNVTDATSDGISVWYKIGDTDPGVPATAAAAQSDNWLPVMVNSPSWGGTASLTSVGEGTHHAYFIAYDKLDNPSIVYDRTILVDYNKPYIKDWNPSGITVLDGSNYAKAGYTLSFKAYDTNELKSVKVTRGTTADLFLVTAADLAGGTVTGSDSVPAPGSGTYSYTVIKETVALGDQWSVSVVFAGQIDGSATYTTLITDIRDKINDTDNTPSEEAADKQKSYTVRVDNTPPNLAVAEPTENFAISGVNLQISGTAYDTGLPNGVTVWYAIDGNASPPALGVLDLTTTPDTPTLGNWNLVVKGPSWDTGIPHGLGAGEGMRYIHFVANDQLENWSGYVNRKFFVDHNPPDITSWTSPDISAPGVTTLAKKDYTFTFTAHDTNGFGSVALKKNGVALNDDGSSQTDTPSGTYTLTKSPSSTPQNWIYTLTLANQADGNYPYSIEILDIAGKSNRDDNNTPATTDNFKTFTVQIDTTGPALEITEPAGTPPVGGTTVYISGKAIDALNPSGVTVWYVIDGNPTIGVPTSPPSGSPLALSGWSRALGSADWSQNAPVSGAEGIRYVHVIAYDSLGNPSSVESASFYVDIYPPQINNFVFTSGITIIDGSYYNTTGNYGFTFKAYDSNALKSITVRRGATVLVNNAIGAYTNTVIGDFTASVVVNSSKEWTVTVGLTVQTDESYPYTIEIVDITDRPNATNNAPGLVTDAFKEFSVLVDRVGPVVAVTSPAVGASVSGSSLYLGGSAIDTPSRDGVSVWYIIDGNTTVATLPSLPPSSPSPGAPLELTGWSMADNGESWSKLLPLSAADPEGERYLHVIAFDKLGNIGNLVDRKYFVDQTPPQIKAGTWNLTGINFLDPYNYAGKNYTIQFTAYDSNALASVKITRGTTVLEEGPQSGYTLTIDRTTDPTNKEWPVTLIIANQSDGNYDYTIDVIDATGKPNTLDNNTPLVLTDDHKNITVIVDTTPPLTKITSNPATVSNAGMNLSGVITRADNVNGVIHFAVSANDNRGVSGVKWFLIPYGTTFDLTTPADVKARYDAQTNPTYLVDSTTYEVLVDTTPLTPQTLYTLYVLAQDTAGNTSYNSTTPFTFFVDQRTDNPLVTLTNLSKEQPTDPDPAIRDGFILRGAVKDDDGVDPSSLRISFFNGSDWLSAGGTWDSSTAVPLPITPTGTITGSGRELTFTYPFPNTLSDGPGRKVVVSALDLESSKEGPAYTSTNAAKPGSVETTFDLDTAPPVITVAEPTDSTYKAEEASIHGTLTEMHPDVFRLSLDGGAYVNHIVDTDPNAGQLVLLNWNSTSGVGNWVYRLPILDTPLLSVGLHTITLEAVDKAGLTTTNLWRFYVDNTGPAISFRIDEVPYPTWTTVPTGMSILREGSLALRGDFRDDYSTVNNTFEYHFDTETESVWHSITTVTGAIANPGKYPSWTLFLDSIPTPFSGAVIPDGAHRVQIRAKDVLDNVTTSAWIGFRVDTADPTITNIQPLEANAVFSNVGNPVFTLTGIAADANLSSVTITRSGVTTPITVPAGATSVNWSYPVTGPAFSALAEGAHRFTITAIDAAGRTASVDWNFIKDTQPPVVEWSNLNTQPGVNSTLFQDISTLKILGVARDSNGVAFLTSTLKKWNGTTWDQVQSDTDLAPNNELVKNWVKDIATAGLATPLDGLYRITINAKDRGGNVLTPAAQREFRIDLAMPLVTIDTSTGTNPLKRYYNGKATGSGPIVVSGTASDANGISSIHAQISGTGAPAWAAADAVFTPTVGTAGTWVVTIPHSNSGTPLPEGGYTLNISATDGAGRISTTYGVFDFDSIDPTVTIDSPPKSARVTESITIRGSNNDSGSGLDEHSIWYQFTKLHTEASDPQWYEAAPGTGSNGGTWGSLSGWYSWNFGFLHTVVESSTTATEVYYDPATQTVIPQSDTGLWQTPFKIKVIDRAGNEQIIDDYFLLVDQFGDVPKLTISSPDPGAVLGGRVYVSGTALDNNYVNKIQYRVKPNPTMAPNEWSGISWIDGPSGFLTGGGNPALSVTWQFDINGDGALNPGAGEGMRPVLIQVRPIDAANGYPNVPGQPGDPVSLLIYFDAGVPRIGNEIVANNVPNNSPGANIFKPYVDGIQVSKTFIFEAEISDDSGLDRIQYWQDGTASAPNVIGQPVVTPPATKAAGSFTTGRKYMIKTIGTTDWMAIGANSDTVGASFTATGGGDGDGTAYEATATQEFIYKLRLEIPTNDGLSAYKDKTGYYSINIQAHDNSSPALRADKSYTVQIDNFYPYGTYSSPNVAAGWYNLRGTARDADSTSGPIQGLEKVVVYLSRNGDKIALHEYGVQSSTDTFNPTTQKVKRASDQAYVTLSDFPADALSGITIDRDEQSAGLDLDLDGYEEAWYDNGADRVWSARIDTTQLKDGPVTVHYVIFDKAGNATYYEQSLFIKNHAPAITSVTLGTDIFGNKTTGGTRLYTTGYFTTPAFVARNQRLSFKLAKVDGNGVAHYRITPVSQQQVAANTIVAGEIYTIVTPGSTDWLNLGALSNAVGTTFVATSNGGGNGQVYKYNTITAAELKTGDFAGNETTEIVYTNFTGIPNAENAYFLIKIYDSTVTAPPPAAIEANQLSDMIVVRVKIENDDTVPPTSRLYDLSPYAKNQSRYDIATTISNAGPGGIGEDQNMKFGGLYLDASNAISGHVEPRSVGPSIFLETGVPSTFSMDTVSGKVILRGYARDNQRISEIQVKFGTATPVKIIQVKASPATISAGHFQALEPVPAAGVRAWVYDDLSLDDHRVEWAYEWDTQTTAGMAIVGNITVRAIALDARVTNYAPVIYPLNPNTSISSLQGTGDSNVNYNTITMTAAPYISSMTTALSSAYPAKPSVFNRSALGLYPVRDTETITINGFNLGGASTVVKIGATTLGTPTVGSSAANQIRVPIGNTAKSGALTATVSSVESVNNRNNNNATFNKEPNSMNNSTLTDNRELYVWNTGALVNRTDLTNPFMRMDAASAYYMSYGRGAESMYFNKGGTETLFEQCFNKFHNTTVAFDTSGNYYGGATNTDRVNDAGGATSFTFYSRAPGNFVTGANAHYDGNQNAFVAATGVNNKRHLELSYNAATAQYRIDRVQIPRIAVIGEGTTSNPAKIYMSYFDGNNANNPVVFRYGTSNGANNFTGGFATQVTGNNPGTAAGAQIVANSTTDKKGGLYTAVGALRDGRAVIAWYDAVNQQLVYSYSSGTDPSTTTTVNWQTNAKVIDTDFAGWHVDLTVDNNTTQGIHIAYYSSSGGDLKYAYLSSYNATPQVVTVDSFLSAGTKLMINTRAETRTVSGSSTTVYVPYISYYHASFPQTPNSVRIAWRNNFDQLLDGAIVDNFTGNWEAMTVPTPNIPIEDFICNGVPTSGNFSGVNLTNSILLSYMTNQYYERAYIKK
ncbi:Ig-like domain-containing protein [Treponema primitia]|uniref:Ig-like domain-containing protein n=1 Tax=Treponema primitia TaxID=88058 RepID=UPI0002554D91|nr:Ig-like domain-containing protein [Treponema primitia]